MTTNGRTAIARPLKVLVPLIQEELNAGNNAGLEHYRRAGEMLIEAKEQLSGASWTQWLARNFALGRDMARRYMLLVERMAPDQDGAPARSFPTLSAAVDRPRPHHQAKWYEPVRATIRASTADVDVKAVAQHRQTQQDEVRLHRELALQLVDIGYKALATRLHPDRGGSKEAMSRLNRVRSELKDVAETRRFV